MKKSQKHHSQNQIEQATQISVGQYVWSNYSFYGDPSPIACYSAPIQEKISLLDVKRPRILDNNNGQRRTTMSSGYFAPNAVALSDVSVSSSSAEEAVIHASIGIHHGKYVMTDDGETIKKLRQKHRISNSKLKHILGNMKTELPVCILGETLGIVLPDTKNTAQYAKTFALIIERLNLICQMTLP